ncbi:MAG: acylphosphatase [bacterium]|nr:acylphosphatase [bacterium]
MTELHAIIRGRVQLVMFRDFAQRKARAHGIKGFVKNRPDGAVEVVAQGEKASVEKLLEALHRGSLLSRVDSVESGWCEPVKTFDDFSITF